MLDRDETAIEIVKLLNNKMLLGRKNKNICEVVIDDLRHQRTAQQDTVELGIWCITIHIHSQKISELRSEHLTEDETLESKVKWK